MSFHHHSPKRNRRSVSQPKTAFDAEINILYESIIKKQQSGYSQEELLPHNEENFKYIYYIMTKINKTDNEIFLVKLYLQNLEKFIQIFIDVTTPLKDLLDKIASQIMVENFDNNNMVCKTGDKGDKVYLILKGSVSVLLQKEKIITMSKLDYICYLVNLHLYQENDLISRILLVNREKFNIDERELNMLFSMFHLYKFFVDNKIKKKYSLFVFFFEQNINIKEQVQLNFDVHFDKVIHLGGLDDFMMNDIFNFYNLAYDNIVENYNKTKLENYQNNQFYNSKSNSNSNSNSNRNNGKISSNNINIDNSIKLNIDNINNNENNNNNQIPSSRKSISNSINFSPKRSSLRPRPFRISGVRSSIKSKSLSSLIDEILQLPSLPYEVIYEIDKENYKKRFIPNIMGRSDLVDFKLYEYIEITTLTEGDIFGEIALQNSSKKRTATIITNEFCVFGTLTKTLYNYCLKSTQEKIRNIRIDFFLNGPIFKGVNQPIFEGKYYNWFIKTKYKNKKVLFKQGEKREKIFFIKKGEVELNSKMTFIELNKLIEYNGGEIKDELPRKYCYESVDFNKFYNEDIQNFKLGCFKDNEIIGLDYFLMDNKFICDCEIYSITCSLFELEDNLYQNLLNENQIKNNIETYIEQKKKILCERLIKIRDTKIENEINNIRMTEKRKKSLIQNDIIKKKANLVFSLMKTVKVNKNIKLTKLPEIENSIHQSNKKCVLSRNFLSNNNIENNKKQYYTISNEKEISKLNNSNNKNNGNNSIVKKIRFNVSINNNDEKLMTMTNLKYFRRKNLSLKEAKNVLNKKPILNLKTLRTKELILPKRNNIKVIRKRYNEKKLLNKEEEFYMTHTQIYTNLFNSESKKKTVNKIKNDFIDVLCLDNWAEKHYINPKEKKQYVPKLKIKSNSKSFNING